MARPGREFEKLVTRIEKMLSPLGAVVKSPDMIPDKVTGQPREVDASIRYQVGSAPILVTIECRDRSAVQDVTWLEQIKSKKESIGANQTIAVSKEGFTEPAKMYAKQHSIQLRQISEVTDAYVLKCLESVEILLEKLGCEIESFRVGFYKEAGDENIRMNLTSEINDRIRKNEPFAYTKAGVPVIMTQLIDDGFSKVREKLWAGAANPGIALEAKFKQGELLTETNRGKRSVWGIQFKLNISINKQKMPPLKPIRYTDEDGNVIESFSQSISEETGAGIAVKFDWDKR